MVIIDPPKVVINGMTFTVVYGTATGPTMTYEEAEAFSKGQTIASSK